MELNCTICQEHSDDEFVRTDCDHLYHISCISNWISVNDTCPLCRSNNPCGIKTYYYTLYYYNVHGLIDGYIFDPYQYNYNVDIRHLDPGHFTVFRKNHGEDNDSDTGTILYEPIYIPNYEPPEQSEPSDEIDNAYDNWEHDNDHDF